MPPQSHYNMDTAKSNAEKSVAEFTNAEGEIAKSRSAKKLQEALNHRDFLEFVFKFPVKFREIMNKGERADLGHLTYLTLHAQKWQDIERKAELLSLAAELDPANDQFSIEAAEANMVIGDLTLAIVQLNRAIEIDPGSTVAHDLLAKAKLMARGEFTRGKTDYRNVKVFDKTLSDRLEAGSDFSNSTFFRVRATGLMAHEARFVGARMSGVDFSLAHLEGANFRRAYAGRFDETSSFNRAVMKRANLDASFFYETDFQGVDLTMGSARGARFDKVSFEKANLGGVDFSDAEIMYSNLSHAEVTGAKFNNVEFRGTRLTNVDFTQASMVGADLEGAVVSCATSFPTEIDYAEVGIIPLEPECNGVLQNRNFSSRRWWGQNFSELDLSGANFSGAQFDHSKFFNSNLRDTDFRRTRGARYYAGADLTGADFTDATSAGEFTEAIDFENNDAPVDLPILADAIFDNTTLGTGQFIRQWEPTGRFADLSTAQFHGAHLRCSIYTDWSRLEDRVEEIESEHDKMNLSDRERQKLLDGLAKDIGGRQKLFTTEGRLVNFFVENWPSVAIDDSCSKHLSGKAAEDN